MSTIDYTNKFFKERTPIFIVVLIYLIVKILFFNAGMFWDSITILSKPATYLYENGIFNFHYPSNYDNGDPQLVPFYIALIWKIFGRTLFITHLAFIPITVLILIQLKTLVSKIFSKAIAPYVFLLVCLDPTLMSQSLGIFQDSFLILFSIFIMNALLDKNKVKTMIFMLILCCVSRRGMLLTSGFMLANFIYLIVSENNSFLKTVKNIAIIYFPAVLFVMSFIAWRLSVYNWFFTTNQTNTGEFVNLFGLFKNSLILVRWFVDDGRIFLWIIFAILIIRNTNKSKFFSQNKFVSVTFISLIIIMMCVTLPIANPFGARYFVVHFLVFGLLVSKLITTMFEDKKVKRILTLMSILLFSGNFWIYPEKLSQSWDSSLAHLSYFNLRNQTISFFEKNKIDFQSVGVGFPMYAKFNFIDIKADNRNFESVDFKQNKWIVYSNVFNFKDKDIEEVNTWILTKEFKQGNVFIKIYKRPN